MNVYCRILNRQSVDRPAFDIGGTDCSSIHVVAYEKLRRHLGLPEGPIRCGCLTQLVAEPDARRARRAWASTPKRSGLARARRKRGRRPSASS